MSVVRDTHIMIESDLLDCPDTRCPEIAPSQSEEGLSPMLTTLIGVLQSFCPQLKLRLGLGLELQTYKRK